MTAAAGTPAVHWRVGHRADPLAFTPHSLCAWNHRFDDEARRFRTIYVAEHAATSLREVLADFRPKRSALGHYRATMGAAGSDLPSTSVTASWRRQHVLASVRVQLDGPVCDLTDVAVRAAVEARHGQLLDDHGMSHLDLHEITSRRRVVTQTIAGALHDRGTAAIRFPSRLDGDACLAIFEGRGSLRAAGDPIALTDPPPQALTEVAAQWQLIVEPAAADDAIG